MVIKEDNLSAFHEFLYSTLPGIRFTVDTAAENKLLFLDVLVYKLPSGAVEIDATNVEVVLHYESNSPASQKTQLWDSVA